MGLGGANKWAWVGQEMGSSSAQCWALVGRSERLLLLLLYTLNILASELCCSRNTALQTGERLTVSSGYYGPFKASIKSQDTKGFFIPWLHFFTVYSLFN
jgi:hypothetical protein